MAELTRLVNHVSLVGFFINDLGALGTPLLYAFREREKILDLFEQASGARMMCNYFRFGGLRNDVPEGWLERAGEVVDRFPSFLAEYEQLLCENEIILSRTQGVGNLPRELAISAGVTASTSAVLSHPNPAISEGRNSSPSICSARKRFSSVRIRWGTINTWAYYAD